MAFTAGVLGTISTIVSVAGSVLGGIQAYKQGKAQEAAYKYQAEVQKVNADIARGNAVREIQTSQIQQEDQDRAARGMLGEQIAQQAASGLSLGGRTQIATRRSARELAKRDALNIRYAGEIGKYNYMQEALNQDAGRNLSLMSAKTASRDAGFGLLSGFLNATGSLIGGAQSFKSATRKSSFTPTPVARPSQGLAGY